MIISPFALSHSQDNSASYNIASSLPNEEFAKVQVEQDGLLLKHQNEKIQNLYDVVITAVRNNGSAIKFASKKLQSDEGIVKESILETVSRVKHAIKELEEYSNTASMAEQTFLGVLALKKIYANFSQAIVNYGEVFHRASKVFKKSKDMCLLVIEEVKQVLNSYNSLNEGLEKPDIDIIYLSLRSIVNFYSSDKDIIFNILPLDSLAFDYASADLKKDRDTILTAIKSLLRSASALDVSTRENVSAFLSFFDNIYAIFSENCKNDRDAFLQLFIEFAKLLNKLDTEEVDKEGLNIEQLYKKFETIFTFFKNDREMVQKVVSINGFLLNCASKELKSDKDIILEAIRNYEASLVFADPHFLQNQSFLLKAIYINPKVILYAPSFCKEKDFLLKAVAVNPELMPYIHVHHPQLYQKAKSILRSA